MPAPDDPTEARDGWRPDLSVFAVHAALRGNLGFPSPAGPVASVAARFGTTDGMVALLDAVDPARVMGPS